MTDLDALTTAMRVCDPTLHGHVERMAELARRVARRLGWRGKQLDELELGVALHDVGKISLPSTLLAKPGALDGDEVELVRAHPVEGAWLIAGIDALRPALPYVLFHHERWDGAGYPTRRVATAIPLEGRLLAVADAFDAMTSDRTYRDALSPDAAVDEIERCAGSQFDPVIARVFVEAFESGEIDVPHAAVEARL